MKMTAAVSRADTPHPTLETVELAEPLESELVVRIVAVGICHTDLKIHADTTGRTPKPVVLGHEGAGVVERVGSAVRGFAPGDRVLLSGSSCGACPNCERNLPSYCRQAIPRSFGGLRMDGSSALSSGGEPLHGHFFGQSSFAQYAVVEPRTAVKVPAGLSLTTLAPLGCGVITGAGAVIESLRVGFGDTLAVFGTGSVGLSAVMAARATGALTVIAVDPQPERLALAAELGATHTLAAGDDVAEAIRDLTDGGVQYSLNTTSVPAVFTQALDCLAMRGTAAFVAAPAGQWAPAMLPMLGGGRRLMGVIGGDAAPKLFIPKLIDMHLQGRFPFDRMIRRYPFERIGDAFDDCTAGRTIKPVLEFEQ